MTCIVLLEPHGKQLLRVVKIHPPYKPVKTSDLEGTTLEHMLIYKIISRKPIIKRVAKLKPTPTAQPVKGINETFGKMAFAAFTNNTK